jgi:hypothetical protein
MIRRASGGEVPPIFQNLSVWDTAFVTHTSLSRLFNRDGDYHQIAELNNDPGFDYWFGIGPARYPKMLVVEGVIYDGSTNHDVEFMIWDDDGSAWVDIRANTVDANPAESDLQHVSFTGEDSPYRRIYNIPEPRSNFRDSNGTVLIRVVHPETGSDTHDIYIDRIYIIDG